jgi:CRISPR-associated protein Csh2
MSKTIENNSEILFLYDANKSNPNGDMDDENKPRMDKINKINLVSDVRLKRYIRDYLKNFKEQTLFIDEDAKDSKDRGKQLKAKNMKFTDCIDVRLFGAVLAQKEDEDKKGTNESYTGPIQFNWANSLNKVELQKSKTITSSFSSGEGIGSDYRVVYSFLAVSGSINAHNAVKTGLSTEDLEMFDEAMLKSIPLCKTRSKIGQFPRLYIRIETEKNVILKDLRELIALEKNENLIGIDDIKLNISGLILYLKKNKNLIKKLLIWKDQKLKLYETDKLIDIEKIKNELGIVDFKLLNQN